jgi:hypothetical protein
MEETFQGWNGSHGGGDSCSTEGVRTFIKLGTPGYYHSILQAAGVVMIGCSPRRLWAA